MGETGIHGPPRAEVKTSGQVDVTLLPERRELIAGDSSGGHFHVLDANTVVV